MLPLALLIGLIVVILIYFVSVYNRLSKFKVRIQEAWSQIDVQLKRRADLIPNLVETVKGYAEHEKEAFENVTQARAAVLGAQNVNEAESADNMMQAALKSIFAIAEAYPELKAQDGFVKLQEELSDTEDKVSYARQFYNSVVRDYNQIIVVFPNNVIANMLGFKQEEFFEADQDEKEPTKVEF